MIDELGPEARALLDLARQGLSPDPAAVARVHARIGHAASGAGAGAAALGAKLGVLALVVGAVAITAVYTTRADRRSTTPPKPAIASPVVTVAASPPASAPASEPPGAVPSAAPSAAADAKLIEIEPSPVRHAPKPHRIAARSPSETVSAAPTTPDATAAPEPPAEHAIDLAREVQLIDHASEALRRGVPETALRTLQRYAIETAGHGQLAEDAGAIEIEAMCLLHDTTAATRLAVFDTRFPHAAQRTRLENICKAP